MPLPATTKKKSHHDTRDQPDALVVFIRKIPAKWIARIPWIVMVVQCLVILVLLFDPVRQCSPVIKTACSCHGNQNGLYGNIDTKDLQDLSAFEAAEEPLETLEAADFTITANGDGVDIKGRMLRVHVPRHPPRLFFNRLPKCGSSTMMDLITEMVYINNFTFGRAKEYMRFYLDDFWMDKFIRRILWHPTPLIYERHIHYFDTTRFGMPQPVFINIVRDPLERMVSWYYFRRYQDGHVRDMPTEQRVRTFDECVLGNYSECMLPGGFHPEEGFFKIIPFFCGQEEYCREPSNHALTQAIHNVKYNYLVVGLMEDFHGFVEVLQFLLPDYFRGATYVYEKLEAEWRERHKTTYKLPVSEEARRIMRQRLYDEYRFYIFAQKRFRRLLRAVRVAKQRMQSDT